MLHDSDLLALQEVRTKVDAAYGAWQKYRTFSQDQIDNIVEAIAAAARVNAQHLAELAVSETGYGNARDKLAKNLLAADLLLHPSYHENTGTALLEALAAGLPVLTTAVCGYAHFITDAHAGMVLPADFSQPVWNDALQTMLLSPELKHWGANGLQFAKTADIYSMPERAADFIEMKARQRVIS